MSEAVARVEPAPASAAVLCRYGEIFLKLGNRSRFEEMLAANARKLLSGIAGARVESPHGRLLAHVPADALADATTRLERLFGLVSLSPVLRTNATMDAMIASALEAVRGALASAPAPPRSFKVEARRSDKRFPHTSYEIASTVGASINATLGLPVDVHNPALVVGVEVRAPASKGAFVFAETRTGPGGLPVGAAGRGLLLLSGGIDSPVAGWLAAKRGLALDGVYFHSPPFVGEKTKDKIVALARTLHRWQACASLTIVNFTDVQKKLREHRRPQLAVVLYRRMMMRIADRVAQSLGAEALVTGDSLGQVASQTVRNMTTIEDAAARLVIRPLVAHDKNETIALAKRIGTFDLSTLPYDDCCSLFLPPHPATGARPNDAHRLEGSLGFDLDAAAADAAATAETITF